MNNFVNHLKLWLNNETALILNPTPLLVLSIVLIVGFFCSRIAKKIHIPITTAQIIGGVLLGHYALNIFEEQAYSSFIPITNFALGFIGFTIGSHLNFRKLHNAGKRIIFITVMDVILTPLVVFTGLYLIAKIRFELALIIAVISATTSPGSIIHIVKELRAKGIFTKTVLATVAFNNVLVILLFYSVYYFLYSYDSSGGLSFILTFYKPVVLLLESVLIGSVVGFIIMYFSEKNKTNASFMTLLILALVVTVGTSETLHFSGLLSSLILGMVISNYSANKKVFIGAFKDIEKEVFTLFFVLAGTHLNFRAMVNAGYAGIILIVFRFVAKFIFPTLGSYLANSTQTIKKWIGISFHPIAGVAIGLVLLCENIPFIKENDYATTITAIVLAAVIVNELVGPILTGLAIKKSGEDHKNRMRLMDFLQEEFIKINLDTKDKWEALKIMSNFLYNTHKIREISKEKLEKFIFDREKEFSTGIGDMIAIPHAIIEGGPKIRGVIGVSKKGIPFESIDGQDVHIIILIATPKKNYDLHLHVLANIAKIFGHNPKIKQKIIEAKSSEEVFEILQTQELDDLNPFFED